MENTQNAQLNALTSWINSMIRSGEINPSDVSFVKSLLDQAYAAGTTAIALNHAGIAAKWIIETYPNTPSIADLKSAYMAN